MSYLKVFKLSSFFISEVMMAVTLKHKLDSFTDVNKIGQMLHIHCNWICSILSLNNIRLKISDIVIIYCGYNNKTTTKFSSNFQLQSKRSRAATTLDMLSLCSWSLCLSEFRLYRWQAGATYQHFITARWALRPWLWLHINYICGSFGVYILPTRPLPELAFLPGSW